MSTETGLDLNTDFVTDERLGPHGLSDAELRELSPVVREILQEIETERQQGGHRFRNLPHDKPELGKLKDLVAEHREKTENLVVLGIGGSALGNIALQTALNPLIYNLLPREQRKGPRLFVLDNIDPVYFQAVMHVLEQDGWDRTLVNVISKSGETAETSAQFLIVRDRLIQALGKEKAGKRLVVTTDATRGTMRRIVKQKGYSSLAVPEGVGGRFSVLSTVALFSAAMCGINIDELLAGAADMDGLVKHPNPLTNPAARIAMIYYLYDQRGKPMHVMIPYSQQLRDLADWYRQLYAESLGKIRPRDNQNVGPTPIKALGATDQHSQVQLYREGPNDKVFTFLEVGEFGCKFLENQEIDPDPRIPQAFPGIEAMQYLGRSDRGTLGGLLNTDKKATELALCESQRPSLTIRFPRINEQTVGEFIYLYESIIPIMGKLYDVNPYDQPAVELGKHLTWYMMGRRDLEEKGIDVKRLQRICEGS